MLKKYIYTAGLLRIHKGLQTMRKKNVLWQKTRASTKKNEKCSLEYFCSWIANLYRIKNSVKTWRNSLHIFSLTYCISVWSISHADLSQNRYEDSLKHASQTVKHFYNISQWGQSNWLWLRLTLPTFSPYSFHAYSTYIYRYGHIKAAQKVQMSASGESSSRCEKLRHENLHESWLNDMTFPKKKQFPHHNPPKGTKRPPS